MIKDEHVEVKITNVFEQHRFFNTEGLMGDKLRPPISQLHTLPSRFLLVLIFHVSLQLSNTHFFHYKKISFWQQLHLSLQ